MRQLHGETPTTTPNPLERVRAFLSSGAGVCAGAVTDLEVTRAKVGGAADERGSGLATEEEKAEQSPCHSDKSHRECDDEIEGPTVSYALNGRYVKLKIPGRAPVGGGPREACTEFSSKSRNAMLVVVNSFNQLACKPGDFLFVTLTYPKNFPSARASKRDLDNMLKRYERAYGPRGLIWKIEPQKRGAPHFHLLIFHGASNDQDLAELVAFFAAHWHGIAGDHDPAHLKFALGELGNRPCVERVRDWQGVANYAAKYLGKTCAAGVNSKTGEVVGDWSHPGRFWGVRRRTMLPIIIEKSEIPAVAAKLSRRSFVKWFEAQPAVSFYIPGKARSDGSHRPGARWYKPESRNALGNMLRGFEAAQELAGMMDVQARPQRRKWKNCVGGITLFLPMETTLRVVAWARREAEARAAHPAQLSGPASLRERLLQWKEKRPPPSPPEPS